jgi:hypothetical protein
MQTRLSDNSSSGILNKPDHILSFVKHALESGMEHLSPPKAETSSPTSNLQQLHIIHHDDHAAGEDSDDEDEEEWDGEEMKATAINLLLSILESEFHRQDGQI